MLEKIDLTQSLDKQDARLMLDSLTLRLSALQRDCRSLGIPVILAFEGPGASGKSTQINQLIHALDPRGYQVFASGRATEEELRHPPLWRFWVKTPAKGRIAVFDSSWYKSVLMDRFAGLTREGQVDGLLDDIKGFEQQLTADGAIVIKFYLHISQKEQKKRLAELRSSKKTAWRVSEADVRCCKHYDDYLKLADDVLTKTDFDFCPWNIVEATDKAYAIVRIAAVTAERLTHGIEARRAALSGEETRAAVSLPTVKAGTMVLSQADLTLSLSPKAYKDKLKKYQKRLSLLHSELHKQNVPLVLVFEGWDAGGKGGAIKRLTEALDPSGYQVNPTSAPNDLEKAHHYLWRFWIHMPKSGHIAIFDRSWYGRVMVERIEGLCSENEWKRAYQEINEMESNLTGAGTIVLKFWMQIDKDEQERRFNERMNTPEKRWKITDEDWRNRAKWDQYEGAVNEMLLRTSTPDAPWIVVEGNDKLYARIKVLKTIVDALEKRLG